MNISKLQTPNGSIKIAAMDHRGSLKKIIPEEKLSDFKNLLTETFADYSTAILVDPEYGLAAIETAKSLNLSILLSREETGYVDNPDGRVTKLSDEFTTKKLKEMGANAIKILLYYNSQASNKSDQIEVVKKVRAETLEEDIPFLVEPITYPIDGTPYNKAEETIKAVEDLTSLCDILKLEFPIDVLEDGSNIETASITLEEIKKKITVPWVLLSKGMQFENYKKVLELCKKYNCSGYAVGRAVWQEISDQPDWNAIETFIKTTALDRSKQLSKLYE